MKAPEPTHSERAVLVALCIGALGAAPPEPPPHVVVQSSSACPSAAQVVEVLAPLLPDTALSVEPPAAGGSAPEVFVEDRGDRIVVIVAGEQRAFSDSERSCSERARLAAFFAGLVLAPPLQPEAAPAPDEAPPAPEEEPPAPDGVAAHSSFELGLSLLAAPGAETSELPLSGGPSLRFEHGRPIGLSLGVSVFLPTTLRYELVDARVLRIPVDASLRVTTSGAPLSAHAELGLYLALLAVSGERVDNAQSELRPELGLRAAAGLRHELDRPLAAFLSLQGAFAPAAHDLELNPQTPAGALPKVWIGAATGVAF